MRVGLALICLIAWTAPAQARCAGGPCVQQETASVSTAWSGDAKAPTRLILASPSHFYGGPVWIAIEMDIADGWFVYATDEKGGAGPRLEWSGSVNLALPAMRWPVPERVLLNGKPAAVYRGHVILPVSIAPIRPDGDITLGLSMSYAVCGEVCRPSYAVHRIVLSAAPAVVTDAASHQASEIADALEHAPND